MSDKKVSPDFGTNFFSEWSNPTVFDYLGFASAGLGGFIAKLTTTGEALLFSDGVKDALVNSKFIVPNEINLTAMGSSAIVEVQNSGTTAAVRDLTASGAGFITSTTIIAGFGTATAEVWAPVVLAALTGYAATKAVSAVFDTWDATHSDQGLIPTSKLVNAKVEGATITYPNGDSKTTYVDERVGYFSRANNAENTIYSDNQKIVIVYDKDGNVASTLKYNSDSGLNSVIQNGSTINFLDSNTAEVVSKDGVPTTIKLGADESGNMVLSTSQNGVPGNSLVIENNTGDLSVISPEGSPIINIKKNTDSNSTVNIVTKDMTTRESVSKTVSADTHKIDIVSTTEDGGVIGQATRAVSDGAVNDSWSSTNGDQGSATFKVDSNGNISQSKTSNTDVKGNTEISEKNYDNSGAIKSDIKSSTDSDGILRIEINGVGGSTSSSGADVTVDDGASANLSGHDNNLVVGVNASLAYTSTNGLTPNLITLASGATFIDHADTATVGDIIKQVAGASGINVTVASGTVYAELSNASIVAQKNSTLNIVGNGNAITLGANASASINDDPDYSSGTNTLQTSQGVFTLVGMHQVSTGADGQSLQDQWVDSATGNELLQTDYAHGVKADVIDFKSGQEIDVKTYDTGGKLVAEDLFKPDIGVSKKTDHELFGSDGQLTQDIQYDLLTGNTSAQIDYTNGVKSDQVDFINNIESDEKFFNNAGQMTNEAFFNAINGSPVESSYRWFDSLGRETAESKFNNAGQQTDYDTLDPNTGVITQDLLVRSGAVYQELDYNDSASNHYETAQVNYNTRGDVINEAFFNASGQETQYLANLANGQSTVQFFGSDLPRGYTSLTQTYNGLDAQGAITSLQGTNASGYTVNENIAYNSAGQESGFTIDWHTPSGVDEGAMDFNAAGTWISGWDDYLIGDPAGSTMPNGEPISIWGGYGYYGGYYGFAGADGTITKSLGSDIGTIAHYDLAQGDTAGAQAAQRGRLEAAAASQAAQSGQAGSAVLDGSRWDSHLISWSLASTANATTSSVYMDAEYEKAAQAAFEKWGSASGLSFQEVTDSAQSDIRLGWGNFDTSSSGVVGYTSFHSQHGQMQPDIRIRLEDPTQLSLVTGTDGQLTYAGTEAEFGQVLEHEIGHALGFADNADPTSIMYYALSANNRTLDATDIAGVRALYGAGSLSSHTATSVDQLIQAMSHFGAPSGAAVTDLMHPTLQTPKALTLAAPVTV